MCTDDLYIHIFFFDILSMFPSMFPSSRSDARTTLPDEHADVVVMPCTAEAIANATCDSVAHQQENDDSSNADDMVTVIVHASDDENDQQ